MAEPVPYKMNITEKYNLPLSPKIIIDDETHE